MKPFPWQFYYNEYQQIGFRKSIDLTALWISEYTASENIVLKNQALKTR